MIFVMKQNLKIGSKFLLAFLSFIFVSFLTGFFSEFSIIVWLFKILIAFLLIGKRFERIMNQSKLKFFKSSFICMGLYWIIIIAIVVQKNKIGSSIIYLTAMASITGMILGHKALSDSWRTIKKYYPQLKMDIEVHSPDDYFENFSRAENLENDISELKKEAPSVVVEAIMQRKAGVLIPVFHFEMIYLALLMLWGTPWK